MKFKCGYDRPRPRACSRCAKHQSADRFPGWSTICFRCWPASERTHGICARGETEEAKRERACAREQRERADAIMREVDRRLADARLDAIG